MTQKKNVIVGHRACLGKLDPINDGGDGSSSEVTLDDCDPVESVIIGRHAAIEATGGIDNVFIGSETATQNSSTNHVFIGTKAGYSNTTGSENIFIGEEAGHYNTPLVIPMFI